jgi:hypothetical protein
MTEVLLIPVIGTCARQNGGWGVEMEVEGEGAGSEGAGWG